jgi:hypothetical protein
MRAEANVFNVLKDVQTGALPAGELPGFFFWLVGKTFWFWFVIIVAGMLFLILK